MHVSTGCSCRGPQQGREGQSQRLAASFRAAARWPAIATTQTSARTSAAAARAVTLLLRRSGCCWHTLTVLRPAGRAAAALQRRRVAAPLWALPATTGANATAAPATAAMLLLDGRVGRGAQGLEAAETMQWQRLGGGRAGRVAHTNGNDPEQLMGGALPPAVWGAASRALHWAGGGRKRAAAAQGDHMRSLCPFR